ncbi:PAS domain S-box protein [Acidimangrovimonas sediminis]|uniref:PAS domain S-box protein n=1 Tax=Acidimangrovimonas sediminis TaxID=2056283 RepID=UPI000C805A92|nr:PAS domain S-box protein [Acidimangrovimonas sediminis]
MYIQQVSGPGDDASVDLGLLMAAIDTAQAVIWFEVDGTIRDANSNFLRSTGYKIDEIRGRHHRLFVSEEHARSEDYRAFWKALSEGRPQRGTFLRRGKDGRPVWLEASYIPLPGPDGRPARIAKFAFDITAQRIAAADQAGQIAAISESHAIVEFDLDGTIRDANENFLRATGYTRKEIIGEHHSIFLKPGEAGSDFYARFWERLREGRSETGEFHRFGKNRRDVWFQASYSPVLDEAGRPVKIIKYASDVTEAKLRAVDHNGQLSALSKAQAVIEFALDGTVLTANENFLAAFGYELGEIQGQHHRMFVPPGEAGSAAYAEFWRKLAEGRFQAAEYRRIGKGGRDVWIQASYNPILDSTGKPFKVVKFATDITDRKRALAALSDQELIELRSTQDALEATEALFRATIDHAPVGMALMDEDCHLLHVNDALCQFTGYVAEDLLEMRLAELIPPNRRVISDEDRARMRSGELRVLQLERRMIRRNGTEAWALLHISQQSSSRSEAVEFIVQVQDITERRQVEQMKSNFVATVSHELRTPLTSIKGGLSLALGMMSDKLDQRAERLLSIALKNCDQLTKLVNDILDMEKISSGQARFSATDVPLADLLEQAAAINQAYGQEHGVHFELTPPVTAAWVRVDVDRFQQVMSNLMSNAAKFSPPGSVVRVESEAKNGKVWLRVIDSGPGIPEEFGEQIFTPFSQADNSATRKKGGTGLGLNITRQIVERMDGEIGYHNRPGGGCEFWVTFPQAAPAQASAPALPRIGRPGLLPVILHLEHDRDFAEIFRSAFEGRAEVRHVATMAEAVADLHRTRFDLIVADWEGVNGKTRRLLDIVSDLQPHAPVFGMSAREIPADPRVVRNLVKSRIGLDAIVQALVGD